MPAALPRTERLETERTERAQLSVTDTGQHPKPAMSPQVIP